MRDKSHEDFVERWADFVKNNPKKWKDIQTEFLNAQFEKNREFLRRLAGKKEGKKKIIEIYDIKNKEGYPSLA